MESESFQKFKKILNFAFNYLLIFNYFYDNANGINYQVCQIDNPGQTCNAANGRIILEENLQQIAKDWLSSESEHIDRATLYLLEIKVFYFI